MQAPLISILASLRPRQWVKNLFVFAGLIFALKLFTPLVLVALADTPLTLPVERPGARHVYYLYTVRHPRRDAFAEALAELGVGTAVHYPLPIPGQPMFGGRDGTAWPETWRATREVISLPCFAELTDDEVQEVAQAVRLGCKRL